MKLEDVKEFIEDYELLDLAKALAWFLLGILVSYTYITNTKIKDLEASLVESNARAAKVVEVDNTVGKVQIKIVEKIKKEIIYKECEHSAETMTLIDEAFQ